MNKQLFKTQSVVPPANAVNEAGGRAYSFSKEHHLAQMACTGMFGDTFYTDAEAQLKTTLDLAKGVDALYIAKLAVYAREFGFMKDMPALLAAVLTTRGSEGLALFKTVFPRVIDNGRMLRTFVQIVRSGRVGRKSFGSSVKKVLQAWFESRSDYQLFRDSVGNDPSLADVIKMVHPRPTNPTRQALYRYLIGKELNGEQFHALPEIVREFETFKVSRLTNNSGVFKALRSEPGYKDLKVPNVPFQMLTSLNLTTEDWKQIAANGNWHFIRMNLNTFARHGVFADREATKMIADKLRDRESILANKVFPYQLLVAYANVEAGVPAEVRNALQDAMEIAIENVPTFSTEGAIVGTDVSGSMGSSVGRKPDGSGSAVRCIDVAGLMSAAVLRKNPNSMVIPFEGAVVTRAIHDINPRDSVMTNANKLASYGGGSTNCSSVLKYANDHKIKANVVIYVSDNESWVDSKNLNVGWGGGGSTATMREWRIFKKNNPKAKMININITPVGTTQASNDADILNIGGFSDTIFETIENFVSAKSTVGKQWVDVINAVTI